jgi:hypothetical protein
MYNNVYLIDCDTVKASTYVNYNVEDETLGRAIRDAQNVYLRDIIGDSLLSSVREKVGEGSIENPENAAYLELLDDYLVEYLAVQAQVCAILPLSFKIRNIGLSQDTDTNIQAAQLQSLQEVESFLKTVAVDKANRIRCYLRENKAAFPELSENACICGSCKKGADLELDANTDLWIK